MDYTVSPSILIEVAFVYQKPVSSSNEVLIPLYRVKHPVSRLLGYYPHLTGRLQVNAESRAHEIGQLGAGIEFSGAHSTARLDDIASSTPSGRILMPNLPSSGKDLLPPFDRNYNGASQNPIFAIQHTRFGCGGLPLGSE
ncbi:transferase family-domain-containing protein [Penicillium canescens]|nr:transferase family-domain-containing protein [Penicillium canescens]